MEAALFTGTEPLPGADMGAGAADGLQARLGERYPRLPATLLADLVRRYGSLAYDVLGDSKEPGDLGRHFGGGLYEREVRYLIEHEWAFEADDILWRRTKTGLHMNAEQRAGLGDFLAGLPRQPVEAESPNAAG